MESSVYSSRAPIDSSCMALAVLWSQMRSKDPRTKVGACVYHHKSGGLFLGYNGFPTGIPDLKSIWDQRDRTQTMSKHSAVVHAEVNAVRKALTVFGDLSECVLYVTDYPCHRCMTDAIIPSGLKNVVFMSYLPADPATEPLANMAKVTLLKSRTEFVFQDDTQKPWDSGAPMGITIRNT